MGFDGVRSEVAEATPLGVVFLNMEPIAGDLAEAGVTDYETKSKTPRPFLVFSGRPAKQQLQGNYRSLQ